MIKKLLCIILAIIVTVSCASISVSAKSGSIYVNGESFSGTLF